MKWKGYIVKWCGLCKVPYIACHECGNSSCNGSGCDKCIEDFKTFCQSETHNLPEFAITGEDTYY